MLYNAKLLGDFIFCYLVEQIPATMTRRRIVASTGTTTATTFNPANMKIP